MPAVNHRKLFLNPLAPPAQNCGSHVLKRIGLRGSVHDQMTNLFAYQEKFGGQVFIAIFNLQLHYRKIDGTFNGEML